MPKPQGFDTTGCWVRLINCLKEIEILAKREDLRGDELLGHDDQERVDYTHYSSCTFIKEGWGISLCDAYLTDFGVFIRPSQRQIDWWYNGNGAFASNQIRPKPKEKYNNGANNSDQRWNCTMQEISNAIASLHAEYAADFYYQENPNEPIEMSWNEGFLRYQKLDITGLLVNEESKESIYFALAFRKALELDVHLYSYDESQGQCDYLNSHKLCNKFNINMQENNFKNLVSQYKARYEAQLAEIRNARNLQQTSDLISLAI